jgi:hypothetical protein
MLQKGVPLWTGILFRRDVLDAVGYLDPEVGAYVDDEFELRVAVRFPIVVNTRPCAFLVGHPQSRSNIAGLAYFWPGWLNTIRNLTEDQSVDFEVRQRLLVIMTRMLIRRLICASIGCVRRRRFGEAYQAGAILRRQYGKKATGLLLQAFAQAARRMPGIVPLMNAFNALRNRMREHHAVWRLAQSGWAGLKEAKCYLALLCP